MKYRVVLKSDGYYHIQYRGLLPIWQDGFSTPSRDQAEVIATAEAKTEAARALRAMINARVMLVIWP